MALAFTPTAYADGHGNEATSDGAFTTLMVQAEDVGAYIKALEASDNVWIRKYAGVAIRLSFILEAVQDITNTFQACHLFAICFDGSRL